MSAAEVGLKPCPFCGGEARWVEDTGGFLPFGLIVDHKPDCWLAGPLMPFDRTAMTAAWNRRAPERNPDNG